MQVFQLGTEKVFVGDRLRAVDAEEVEKLAVSFRELGQLSPIHVGPADADDGCYPLIAGAHRLAAAKAAGLGFVLAIVFTAEGDQARLHEIDENLHRHELTPFDQAAFVAERRAIFERLNGRVKAGRPGKNNSRNLRQLTFWDDTTAKFGLSRDSVERALKRFNSIHPDVWAALRGTPAAKNASELDRLAALEAGEQRAVVKWLSNPTMNVSKALAKVRGTRAPEIDDDGQFQALLKRWDRASAGAKRQFLEHLREKGQLT